MTAPAASVFVTPQPAVARYSDTGRALLTMSAFSMIGNSVLVVQPMAVGALVDLLHFSEREAGFIAAAELLGFSLGGLALLTFVHKVNRRVLAVAGVAVLVVMDLLACLLHTFPPMLVIRFMAGVGAAVGYSIFPVLAAASSRPERVFGIVNAVSIAYAGVFVLLAPMLLHWWHLPGLYGGIAAISLLVCPTIGWTPPRAEDGTNGGAGSAAETGAGTAVSSPKGVPTGTQQRNIFMLLAVLFFLYVGHGGIWAYQERIGISAGLTKSQVGSLLGSSMLIWGVAGSLLATWLGLVIGRVWPQIISLGTSIVAAMLLVFGVGTLTYGVACALIAFSWFYGLPYQTGLLSLFDPKGRANIAGTLVATLGSALGPSIAAMLLGYGGHAVIGVLAAVCYSICMTLVLLSIAELARTHPEAMTRRSY
jgi:predicted MFS family arabinose efflux permease